MQSRATVTSGLGQNQGKEQNRRENFTEVVVSGCEEHNCVQTSWCLGASLHFNTIP